MSYALYTISGAPRPWRALLGLVAKGLEFEVRTLDASKREHKAASFLALNSRGRVPVLEHGDFVLTESLAILSYLERVHPEPPIFGTTPREHARIWQLVGEGEHDLHDSCGALTGAIFGRGLDDTSPDVQKGAAATHLELRRLETVLEGARFLVGERVTAAECMCFPEVRLVVRATERFPDMMRRLELHPFRDAYPNLARWVDRIEALPGYEKSFPSHWRPG